MRASCQPHPQPQQAYARLEADWLAAAAIKQERDAQSARERKVDGSIPLLAQTDPYDRCNRRAALLPACTHHTRRCTRDLNNTGQSGVLEGRHMTVTKVLP